jgi:hypothetical protein
MQLTMRRWKVLVAIAAALGALAFLAISPAQAAVPHTAAPRVLSESLWDDSFLSPTFSLHAQAHGDDLTTCHSGCTAQAWNAIDCHEHTFWNGGVDNMCNLHLEGTSGTSECANWDEGTDAFVLDSCVDNDAYEEFSMLLVSGTVTQVINYEASDVNREYTFFSAAELGEGSLIYAEVSQNACSGCANWYYA